MIRRTRSLQLIVLSLLLTVLSACAVQPVETPNRTVEISMDAALVAQDAMLNAMATGQVTLTESEFSSFLTKVIETNNGPNQPIDSLVVWIEPDKLHLRVTVKEGVFLEGVGNTLDLVGNLIIVDSQLQVELEQVASGFLVASGPILQLIAAQINASLAQQLPPLPLNVVQEMGTLTINLG